MPVGVSRGDVGTAAGTGMETNVGDAQLSVAEAGALAGTLSGVQAGKAPAGGRVLLRMPQHVLQRGMNILRIRPGQHRRHGVQAVRSHRRHLVDTSWQLATQSKRMMAVAVNITTAWLDRLSLDPLARSSSRQTSHAVPPVPPVDADDADDDEDKEQIGCTHAGARNASITSTIAASLPRLVILRLRSVGRCPCDLQSLRPAAKSLGCSSTVAGQPSQKKSTCWKWAKTWARRTPEACRLA